MRTEAASRNRRVPSGSVDLAVEAPNPGDVIEVRTVTGNSWWMTRTSESHFTRDTLHGVAVHTTSTKWGASNTTPANFRMDRMIHLGETCMVNQGGRGATSTVSAVYVNGRRIIG